MKRRARAIARHRDPMPWLPWAALLAAMLLASVAAQAQSTSPTLPPGTSNNDGTITPPKPDRGIIVPPPTGTVQQGNPDPGISVPRGGIGTMPVIPPPGTPGGNPNVVPK